MKLLFYCTKQKPYLEKLSNQKGDKNHFILLDTYDAFHRELNGYVVGECEIEKIQEIGLFFCDDVLEFEKKCCMTMKEVVEYTGDFNKGYALYLKNVKIYNSNYKINYYGLDKAPQNMCHKKYPVPYNNELGGWEISEDEIIISVKPEWLCKILNGQKTIEIRKQILKSMKKEIK